MHIRLPCLTRSIFAVALLVGCGTAAPADENASREQLNAVLWMQNAAEYRMLAEQAYGAARRALDQMGAPGSAALEQWDTPETQLAPLPTAIVLDLDETVLDNSYYQARLVRDHQPYSAPSWRAWVEEAAAPALPGAQRFLTEAAQRGHRIFYVTNRSCADGNPRDGDACPGKSATRRNLLALGLPFASDPEALLLRGERPEWNSLSKTARRQFLAQRYRIVALFGDDLGDFSDRPRFVGDRERLSRLIGTRWFVMPNAMYGGWERALLAGTCAQDAPREECGAQQLARKYALLATAPDPLALPGVRRWDEGAARDQVRIASWNIEWLMSPQAFDALAADCVPRGTENRVGGARVMPCNVRDELRRGPGDFAALRRYAAQLDADVVALAEVDGPEAARLVFPGYDYCFAGRMQPQRNGFAIRAGLPHRCEADYLPLSLDDEVRRGAVVTLFPGTRNEMTLMSVHLKSGCPQGPLTAAERACRLISRQVAPLEAWIDAQAGAGRRFGLTGDFNRRFSLERGPARDAAGQVLNLGPEINDADPPAARLTDITAGRRFVKCAASDPYDSYIDTSLYGRELARQIERNGFIRVVYADGDVARFKLSDHCPVGATLTLR
ncbi:MAG: HAD family acid phosphatase [Steroidobacteraceae bacterium]